MREHASVSRDYEMMIVIAPTVGDEGLPAEVERVSGFIATVGGEVTATNHENPWGRRRLAYPINDHRDAFYVLYRFTAGATAIDELERELRLDDNVIRHLIVRYDQMTEHTPREPRERGERGERGEMPFRRTPAAEAGGPAPSAEPARPVEPQAAAVEATSEGDTSASTETADPGEQTESSEA